MRTSDKPRWGAFYRIPGLQAVKVMKNKDRNCHRPEEPGETGEQNVK